MDELHSYDNKVNTPSTSLLKPKDDPQPVVLTPRINSTGKPVPGTQDSHKVKRDSIPDGTWVTGAYGDESGSDVHSSRINDCTRETGTINFLRKKFLCKNGSGLWFLQFIHMIWNLYHQNFKNGNKNGQKLRSR